MVGDQVVGLEEVAHRTLEQRTHHRQQAGRAGGPDDLVEERRHVLHVGAGEGGRVVHGRVGHRLALVGQRPSHVAGQRFGSRVRRNGLPDRRAQEVGGHVSFRSGLGRVVARGRGPFRHGPGERPRVRSRASPAR